MTESLSDSSRPHCQAGRGCDRAPCFQARLEAATGEYHVHKRTDLCAEHLGAAIQAITAWARDQGLHGEVTVLAIDLPDSAQTASAWSRSSLAFATIALSPPPPGEEPPAEASQPASATLRENGPPGRSAPPSQAVVSPVSLADSARGARLNWASGCRHGQHYRELRGLGDPARPARKAGIAPYSRTAPRVAEVAAGAS
jgi:hypothetical protein